MSLAILLFLAALTGAAVLLRHHGPDGLLYLVSAYSQAMGDAIATGRERYRRSLAEYTREAKVAARVMAESL